MLSDPVLHGQLIRFEKSLKDFFEDLKKLEGTKEVVERLEAATLKLEIEKPKDRTDEIKKVVEDVHVDVTAFRMSEGQHSMDVTYSFKLVEKLLWVSIGVGVMACILHFFR